MRWWRSFMKTVVDFKFLIVFSLIGPNLSWAEERSLADASPKLACESFFADAFKDSSYIFKETTDGFELLVEYGKRGVPIEPDPLSVVRAGDLEGLEERAEILSKIPNRFRLQFKKSDCQFETSNSEISWNCYIRNPGKLGDLEYIGAAFFVYSQKIQSPWSSYRIYNVGLEFRLPVAENWSQNMNMVIAYENSKGNRSCRIPDHEDVEAL